MGKKTVSTNQNENLSRVINIASHYNRKSTNPPVSSEKAPAYRKKIKESEKNDRVSRSKQKKEKSNSKEQVRLTPSSLLYKKTVKKILVENKTNLIEKFVNSKKLESVLEMLEKEYGLTHHDILGLGTSCITFHYKEKNEVIKVCSKKIKYLHHNKKSTPLDLKRRVEPLSEWLLPMKEVVHDGTDFFVYTQECCKPLKDQDVDTDVFLRVIDIVKGLFANELIVGQIKPKNVGFFNDKLYLFDYHSMHELKYRMIDKADWWSSLNKSLIAYSQLRQKNMRVPSDDLNNCISKLISYLRDAKASNIDLDRVNILLEKIYHSLLV